MRTALAEGLAEKRRTGINSLAFGLVGSTDNHLATVADLQEWDFNGIDRPFSVIEPGRMSTGGLAGVWAQENRRETLFDAMERREVFATSGTRIKPRLFAAWEFDESICSNPDMLEQAYAGGTPMGGVLALQKSADDAEAREVVPHFLAAALADTGTAARPGMPLQRMQIIKVWPGGGNKLHQSVVDIAVATGSDAASVDISSCETEGPGARSFCTVWQDDDYEPGQQAVYYLRVLENPSCRHTGYSCMPRADGSPLPAFCQDPDMPRIIQERAWTSPIWVEG